jgi:hypothetical protein
MLLASRSHTVSVSVPHRVHVELELVIRARFHIGAH